MKREKAKDILMGLLAGYAGGILMMMIIHFLIKGPCADGANPSSSSEVGCFEGWMLLAGEKTCFYDTYFEVNTTVVGTDSSTNNVDQYFSEIATKQDENDDILVGAVFKNDRGFYQWISNSVQSSPVPALSTTAPATNSCINHLEVDPTNWGLNFMDGNQECIA